MSIELKIPNVGESIQEVQISRWLKQPGDVVAQDEDVVELETEKASLELSAPQAGTLAKILLKEGETAAIGDVIGYLDESDGAPAAESGKESQTSEKPEAQQREEGSSKVATGEAAKAGTAGAGEGTSAKGGGSAANGSPGEVAVTPSARRALREHGLSAKEVAAPGSRIDYRDVIKYVESQQSKSDQKETAAVPQERKAPRQGPPTGDSDREYTVAMSPLRKRIARRLVEAQQTAALLTTFNEVDLSAVKRLRSEYRERFEKKYQVRLGYMSFFAKAVVDALREQPLVNAIIRDDQVVYRDYYHLGIAIGSEEGLVVPVLRDADLLSFAEIEQAIDDFAKRAGKQALEPHELQGGTFTITNGGIFGSLLSTPIVNPPQSGVLGMHAIEDRPVARNGQVVIRPMMYVALTYDHRLIDGREAVTFLKRIKETIEEPARMLMEV